MSSTTTKGTVKDFFVYLGLALVLFSSLLIITSLCFDYIDLLVSAKGGYYQVVNVESIRWEISALVILFPLLLGLSYLTNSDIRKDFNKLEVRSRKWLLYSVIFVASVSGVIDIVYLVYSFLAGDLTKEFLLKLFTVLVIAGVAFIHCHQELKRGVLVLKRGVFVPTGIKILGGLTGTGVVVLLIFGFYTVGLPATQRQHKQDEQRISDLYQIKNGVFNYYRVNGKLPENLEALKNNGFDPLPKDPETHDLYEYKVVSQNSFEVCGNFKTNRMTGEYPSYDNWIYRVGKNCFASKFEQVAK